MEDRRVSHRLALLLLALAWAVFAIVPEIRRVMDKTPQNAPQNLRVRP